MQKFAGIYELYNSSIDTINKFSQAFVKKEPLVFNGKSLRQFLDEKAANLKNLDKEVSKLPTKTAADKNAVTILKLLLKLYEPILKKIEKDFDYTPIIKKQLSELKFTESLSNPNELTAAFGSIAELSSLVGTFAISNSTDYNETSYNDYNANLLDGVTAAGHLAESKTAWNDAQTSAKIQELDRVIKDMNGKLKTAKSKIDTISTSKAVRSFLKDLLSKYEEFRDKFESDMKEYWKITKLDRFKNLLPGGKKGGESASSPEPYAY